MAPIKVTVHDIYNESEESYEAFLDALDQSLNPRSPDTLYDQFGSLGPGPDSLVLDIGCRNAKQACEIAERFGCHVVGVDLVDANIQDAQKRILPKGVYQSVQVVQGDIQQLPLADGGFDFIWCRDVLGHIPDLHQLFKSCARVLKPGGKMMIFQVLATNLLTKEEADHLYLPLAIVPENMSPSYFERAFTASGFSLIEADVHSSEWREYGEETESRRTSMQLLRIARMRRNREQLLAQFGEKDYAIELADCHYGVYQMLGKLRAVVYTLSK